MNKSEVLRSLADSTGLSKNECSNVLDSLRTLVVGCIKSGDNIKIFDGATLKPHQKKSRVGTDPYGNSYETSSYLSCKLSLSKSFLEVLNDSDQ